MTERRQALKEHDVTDLIGFRVIVANTAHEIIDDDGEVTTEIPDIKALSAAAAVGRCLMPARLQGSELRAIRRIAGWTAADLALKLGEKTSAETISRWENDKQSMGGYAEKVFRLVVCEELADVAPGVGYQAGQIARLVVYDPWREDASFVVPPLVFERVKVRREDRQLVETWEMELAA
jgi:DNA-binding transcriptional regulator YiaG